MNSDIQIEYLDKFINSIDEWIENINKNISADAKEKVEDDLKESWGIVEEVFKQLNISYSGELWDYGDKRKNSSGNFFIDGFVGQGGHPIRVSSIRKLKALTLGAKTKLCNLPPQLKINTDADEKRGYDDRVRPRPIISVNGDHANISGNEFVLGKKIEEHLISTDHIKKNWRKRIELIMKILALVVAIISIPWWSNWYPNLSTALVGWFKLVLDRSSQFFWR